MSRVPISLEKRRIWLGAALIAGAASAAYADSFAGAFQFDDFPAIQENATLLRFWPLPGPFWPPPGSLTVSGRPILNVSFALNHALSGFSLWSYHAANLLIHLGAALVLLGVVRRTFGRLFGGGEGDRRVADWAAVAVAGLWAVHPLTTGAVTYLVQRGEALMALFYLLTIYCFIRSVSSDHHEGKGGRGWRWLVLSVFSCLLGMGTKEVMVSAPLAVLFYDRTFVARGWRAAWRAGRIYYIALVATWIPLALLVASSGGNRGGTSGFNLGVAAAHYWFTQIEAITRYLGLVFWPHPLVFEYGAPTFPFALSAYGFGPLLGAVALATVMGLLRGRPWAFCTGCVGMILAPTSIMPGTIQFAVEYRMYLPLAVILALLVGGLVMAGRRWPAWNRIPAAGWATLVVALVIALGVLTARRNWIYRSDLALWGDSVAKRPESAKAQSNLGMAFSTRGRTAEAIACYLAALRLSPGQAETHYNLGLAYEAEGRPEAALPEFLYAARRDPTLVYAYSQAGRLLDRFGRPEEAERMLRQAIAKKPSLASAHGSLGVALAAEGRSPEAIQEFEASLRLDPAQPEVEFDLGIALAGAGRVQDAAAHYAAAVRLQPDNPDAQENLGVALFQLGQVQAALPPLRAVVRLRPDLAAGHANLATALEETGQLQEALGEFRRALQLRPGYPEAHYNLGNALLRARDVAGARAEFAEAVRLNPNFTAARDMLDRLAGFPSP